MRKDWSLKVISEICLVTDYVANGSFKSLSDNVKYNYEKDYAILLRTTDFTNNFKKDFVYVNESAFNFLNKSTVYPNDIIICNVGSVGITFLVPDLKLPMTIGPNSILVRPFDTKIVDNKFFYFLIQSPVGQDLIKSITSGTTQSKFNKTNFRKLQVHIPPLTEQLSIVGILNQVSASISKVKSNAEQNLNYANELYENALQELFENENWEHKNLGDIATFKNGMNFTKSSKGQYIEIVGVKNFKNNFWVPFQELERVVIDGQLREAYLLKKGDIITVRSNGNPKLIGRTLLADDVSGSVSHSGFTIRIRLNPDSLLPEFLCHYLKTLKTRRQLVESGSGVGIKSLNQGSLSSLMIPFPKSKEEQKQIVKKLMVLSAETQKLKAIYQQKIKDLEELKMSILQKAFNGELKIIKNLES